MLFVRAADCGGLSAAARELDMEPAAASAGLKRLEAALAVRLFVRSTRSLRLTPDGEQYLLHARNVLLALDEGAASLVRNKETISGELNISIPSDLGRNVLLPWLDEFQLLHPDIQFRIRVSDRLADLYRQTVDVAIRYGAPEDSNMVALPLLPDNRRVLCASPDYFKRHGTPKVVADLSSHNCLRFVLGETVHERWTFHKGKKVEALTVDGDRVSDDADLVRRWAIAGKGLAYKSRVDVSCDLNEGRLVAALKGYQGEAAPLNLVCAHRLMLSPAIVGLRDFLRPRLADLSA